MLLTCYPTVLLLSVLGAGVATPVEEPASPPPPEQLVVMPLGVGGVDTELTARLDPLLVHRLSEALPHDVVGLADLEALLDAELMRDVVGCNTVSCMSEIAAAFDSRYMVTGSVSRVGETYFVALQLYDLAKRKVARRSLAQAWEE